MPTCSVATTQTLTSNYYVYQHKLDGQIVYIGSGYGGRAWQQVSRRPDHREHMLNQLPYLNVEFTRIGLSKLDALEIEKILIAQHKPKYNTKPSGSVCFHKGKGVWRSRATVDKKRIHVGEYNTQEEATEALEKFWETL
jgi:hypothetical protein